MDDEDEQLDNQDLINAVRAGDLPQAQQLATFRNINNMDENDCTALWHAVHERNIPMILFLLSVPGVHIESGEPPLLEAWYSFDAEIIGILLDAGADHNETFSTYDFDSHSLLIESIREGGMEVVKELLKRESFEAELIDNLNEEYSSLFLVWESPLSYDETAEIFKIILPYSTPEILNRKGVNGRTLFADIAIRSNEGTGLLQLLIEYGAIPFEIVDDGKTLYDYIRFANRPRVIRYLEPFVMSLQSKAFESIYWNKVDISALPPGVTNFA